MSCTLARYASLALLLLFVLGAHAQSPDSTQVVDMQAPDDKEAAPLSAEAFEPPSDWHLHFDSTAGLWGANVVAAYDLVADRAPLDTIVVAVIDSGIDIAHEDLDDVIWVNPDEVRNGLDDDGNGYADDLHGWNFIGGPDSTHVEFDTYEVTRLYAQLLPRFANVPATDVALADSADYALYLDVRARFEADAAEARQFYTQLQNIEGLFDQALMPIRKYIGEDEVGDEDLEALRDSAMPLPAEVKQGLSMLDFLAESGITPADLTEALDAYGGQIEYGYNLDYDPRSIVGDDYDDATERVYGNADVYGPAADHGTHVAGIIAAERLNSLGVAGVAAPVRIMVLRTVPDGDERDKDVANAIRYAVDNGARVVNMSFGKGFSPQKAVVDEAVRYAEERGVLLVHAAGNSAEDLDTAPNFPTRRYLDGTEATNWITVGASSWEGGARLAAEFSNYGQTTVDLFAPGVAITSTMPESTYDESDGTSMAAPVVAGAAALLLAYAPDLTPQEVRRILMDTATPFADLQVEKPSDFFAESGPRYVPFGTLSVSGGLLNVGAALEAVLARE
ncbi:MAG: S8 family peptidase [Bacteroidota bacterium]